MHRGDAVKNLDFSESSYMADPEGKAIERAREWLSIKPLC